MTRTTLDHMTRVPRDWRDTERLWISDHRLFCLSTTWSEDMSIDVYNFGAQASITHTKIVEGKMAERSKPSTSQILPWGRAGNDIFVSCGCHGSITFVVVKAHPLLKSNPKLTAMYYVRRMAARC